MTIAILSWAAHETLINTLESYRKYNLDDEDKIIFFQEYSDDDIEIAHRYGYRWIGSPFNVGIGAAYAALANQAKGEFFLFLENDWELICDPINQIYAAQVLLHAHLTDVVRLRHRSLPGAPLWTMQFQDREMERPTHLLDSVHWTDPAAKFPDLVKRTGVLIQTGPDENVQEVFWGTDAGHANWTNNPTLFRTDWVQENIVPRVGDSDLERDIQSWWEQQSFRVSQGNGLFTHNRVDR